MAIYVALFEENVSFYVLVGLTVYKKEFKTSEVLKKTFYLSPLAGLLVLYELYELRP